jgi:iron complex outermembrane receptor protein
MNRKLTPIASAVTLMLMGVSMSAQAQVAAAPDQPVETVVVTGIRASLQKSMDQKRGAIDQVEVITAEDIGKMPDKNVADSLERLPGVTISSAGATEGGFDEADRVSMRGTSPSLTSTLLNGHGVATGDWFVLDQSGTVGRSVSYTLFPSEVVGSVVVYKSSEAKLVEGGVAGSVDILTRKPLDFKNQLTAEATIGVEYSDLPGTTDPQLNGLINWKNDNKTFGLLIGAFDEKRHLERQGEELLNWNTIQASTPVALAHPDLVGVQIPGDIGSALFTQTRTRTGGEFDAQFKVSNDFSFDVNGFTSLLEAPNVNRNYLMWLEEFIGAGDGKAYNHIGESPNAGYTVTNGVLTSATWAGLAGTNYGVYDQISRPNESESARYISLDGKLRVNSDLKFSAQVGTSAGDGKTPTQDIMETTFGTGAGASYQMNGLGSAVSWNVGNNATASSPSASSTALSWTFGSQDVDVRDIENWYQIDGEWAVAAGNLTTLQFGLRFNNHDRSSEGIIGQALQCAGGGKPWTCSGAASPYTASNLPTATGNYPSGFGSALGGSFPTSVWYYSPAQLAAFDSVFSNRGPLETNWSQDFEVHEKDGAGYVQGNLEGNSWSGNVGLRLVSTREYSAYNYGNQSNQNPGGYTGIVGTGLVGEITTSAYGPYVPIVVTHTYNDVLPSLNLKFDLTKDLVARFSAARTMARPDFSALAGVVSTGAPPAAGVAGSATGGNPNLKPIISDNVDATVEWYFAPHSLLSATLFDMDMSSYVGYGNTVQTLISTSAGGAGQPPAGTNTAVQWDVTSPINVSANVWGTELSYQQPFLKNFGVLANYTYTHAVDQFGNPVVGASRDTGNLTLYYEDPTFNARLAFNSRSSFYSGLDRSTAFFQDTTQTLAATLGYKYNDHLAFSLDGMNLNNPVLKYFGPAGDSQPERFYVNGRQFYLNAHIKY